MNTYYTNPFRRAYSPANTFKGLMINFLHEKIKKWPGTQAAIFGQCWSVCHRPRGLTPISLKKTKKWLLNGIGWALLFFALPVAAQTDTEFWFAAPEVTQEHGDRPIGLKISTLSQSAQVRVSLPANPNFAPITATVQANSVQAIDLTPFIGLIESAQPNAVLNTGILIESTAPVSCYYEVSPPNNSDIFALKGKNALGNEFIIPGQNHWNNVNRYTPPPFSSFDIVATEDNTVVEITPTNGVVGHAANETFLVRLNRGQVFSVRAASQAAFQKLGGSVVVANKPVGITIKDDSIIHETCYDLVGDQIVPIKVTGKEYVVSKGFLNSNERIFITATENNTQVFIGAQTQPIATLQRGQVFDRVVTEPTLFIRATAPIYVLHLTGFGCEIGGALLPPINCNGSFQIGFTRSTSEFFGLIVLVSREGRGNFRINGSPNLLTANDFSPVPGTNDRWYVAQKSLETWQLPAGSGNLIANTTESFQLGIINGNAFTSCRYGYFSSFASLFIGDDIAICEGGSRVLDAGPGSTRYEWSTGETTRRITVTKAGQYWVKATLPGGCELADTLNVTVSKATVSLGPDRTICPNETLTIDPGPNYFSYRWSNGSTNRVLSVRDTGTYWVEVRNFTGCIARDSVRVGLSPTVPRVNLGADRAVCPGTSVTFDATNAGATYRWQNGTTAPTLTTSAEGLYWVEVTRNGCAVRDSVRVTRLPQPVAPPIDGSASVCPAVQGVKYRFEGAGGPVYQWFVAGGTIVSGQGSNEITVNWGGTNANASVRLVALSDQGCPSDTVTLPVTINVELNPEQPQGAAVVCLNQKDGQVYTTRGTTGSVYTWEATGGTVVAGQGTPQATINWSGVGTHRVRVLENSVTFDTICNGVSPDFDVVVFKDSANVAMRVVSYGEQIKNRLFVSWRLANDAAGFADSLSLFRRVQGAATWTRIARLPRTDTLFEDNFFDPEQVQEYRIETRNHCGEVMTATAHNSILLSGTANAESDLVNLNWNAYLGWPAGVSRYEIWRALDGGAEQLIATVNGNTLDWAGSIGADGFVHIFRVRAVQANGSAVSWSSEVLLEFEHPLFFPNVFTPNGDGKNEAFEVVKINLYPNNTLTVFNRWGEEVFQTQAYLNNWEAKELPSGTYFYVMEYRKPEINLLDGVNLLTTGQVTQQTKVVKGYVQVIR